MFLYTAVYVGPNGTYFDVLGPLPDAPAGSVLLNVSGCVFGAAADELAHLLSFLTSESEYGHVVLLPYLVDEEDQLTLCAFRELTGISLVVDSSWSGNHQVLIPFEQTAAVRAAIEEAARGE
jgi:hypothetical protein